MNLLAISNTSQLNIWLREHYSAKTKVIEMSHIDEAYSKQLLDFIKENKPEKVIYNVGNFDVDWCMSNPGDNIKYNSTLVLKVVKEIEAYGGGIIYLSSGLVYGSRTKPFNEKEKLNPTSPYAVSRYFAEKAVQDFSNNYKILRLGPHYGPESTFITYTLKRLKAGENVTAVKDVFFSPVYIDDILLACDMLLKDTKHINEVYNLCGPDKVNHVEFMCILASVFGLDASIVPITAMDLAINGVWRSPRPKDNSMICSKIFRHFNFGRKRYNIEQGIKKIMEVCNG